MYNPHRTRSVTSVGKGVSVVKTSAAHGMRQLRCTKCHGLASSKALPNGKTVVQCNGCGAKYTMTKF